MTLDEAKKVLPGMSKNLERVQAIAEINAEYGRATMKFGPFSSEVQGLCIIVEEIGELAAAVLQGKSNADVRTEAVQIGAMVLRFIVDCCGPHGTQAAAATKGSAEHV